MRKAIIILALMGITERVYSKQVISEKFISALEMVESTNNPYSIGDNTRAAGILQIWEIVLIDVNRFAKTDYTLADRFDKTKSETICRLYLTHYAKSYERRTHKKATQEVLARIWNGGPRGMSKTKTLKYWLKVKRELGK